MHLVATERAKSGSWTEVVGAAVRARRVALGYTQDELAQRLQYVGLDWDQAAIARLEAGRRGLDFRQAAQVALTLEVELVDLFGGEDQIEWAPGYRIAAPVLRAALRGRPAPIVDSPIDNPELRDLHRAQSPNEAERKAAKRLGVAPERVAQQGRQLWGRRLSHERDARVEQTAGTDRRSLQALRGHVTRQLLAELAAHLEENR